MHARFSIDKNPIDSLWKAAFPAAFDDIQSLLSSPQFRKRSIFKSYDNPQFRASWNLTYTDDYVDLLDTLLFLQNPPKGGDGVLHVSNTYSDYVQVSYGFTSVATPHYNDRYQFAISIDLLTWSASRLVTTLRDLSDERQRNALWGAIDLVDLLPRLPDVTDYTPLRRMVEAVPSSS